MYFSAQESSSSKVSSLALVALLHLLIGSLIIKGIAMRPVVLPSLPDAISVHLPEQPRPLPPPPPPEPPPPAQVLPLPQVVVPIPEIVVTQQPPEHTVQATTVAEPVAPERAPPVPATSPATSTVTSTVTPTAVPQPAMRSAVLVDANACARPEYPVRALRNRETGVVALALLVNADGTVASSRVTKSSGSRDLDRAAQAALGLCRFQPAMENGQPHQAWASIAYEWSLD